MNKKKKTTSSHLQWNTSWQSRNCRRKTRLVSSAERKEPELHSHLHRIEWCELSFGILILWYFQLHVQFQQVFKNINSVTVFPKTMSPYQQWSLNCQKILGERILEKGFLVIAFIHSFICLFTYMFIEHLLCLGCWAKFLRICRQIKWHICLPSSWQSSGDISITIVQWGLKCHNVCYGRNI